ncbi:MAG: glucose-1-phosphate thymidylyltransferase RfbA [Spirochaetia bacterium]|nr:glucose-1-phosphate thymidylyltransferase RfbA [Spirochaetia bacterium]
MKIKKGIVLAGGSRNSLYPIATAVSKHFFPLYNKPMIYYPVSTLMLAGIKDILLISAPEDLPVFQKLLGDGLQWGISIRYAVQPKPRGIAEAFIIAEDFIDGDSCALILGDNLFYGYGLSEMLSDCVLIEKGAKIFAYRVKNPQRYGVVEFDSLQRVISVEEKPLKPKSPFVVTGLYFFDNHVVERAKSLKLSNRDNFEISDLIKIYLENGELIARPLGRGMAWLDTSTFDSLLEASNFIKIIEERQGLRIGCLEEIAYRNNFISKEQFKKLAESLSKTEYGQYLYKILINKI